MFQLSREEFMNVFFDDLALPNLIKTQLMGIEEMKTVRAGYTNDGTPANINIVRSLRGAGAAGGDGRADDGDAGRRRGRTRFPDGG